jgi:hypothetical protein
LFFLCFITQRLKERLRVFQNRVLRRIFGPEREEVAAGGEDCVMISFITYSLHQMLVGCSNQGAWDGNGM